LQHTRSNVNVLNETQNLQPVEKIIVEEVPKFIKYCRVIGCGDQMVRPETAGIGKMGTDGLLGMCRQV